MGAAIDRCFGITKRQQRYLEQYTQTRLESETRDIENIEMKLNQVEGELHLNVRTLKGKKPTPPQMQQLVKLQKEAQRLKVQKAAKEASKGALQNKLDALHNARTTNEDLKAMSIFTRVARVVMPNSEVVAHTMKEHDYTMEQMLHVQNEVSQNVESNSGMVGYSDEQAEDDVLALLTTQSLTLDNYTSTTTREDENTEAVYREKYGQKLRGPVFESEDDEKHAHGEDGDDSASVTFAANGGESRRLSGKPLLSRFNMS